VAAVHGHLVTVGTREFTLQSHPTLDAVATHRETARHRDALPVGAAVGRPTIGQVAPNALPALVTRAALRIKVTETPARAVQVKQARAAFDLTEFTPVAVARISGIFHTRACIVAAACPVPVARRQAVCAKAARVTHAVARLGRHLVAVRAQLVAVDAHVAGRTVDAPRLQARKPVTCATPKTNTQLRVIDTHRDFTPKSSPPVLAVALGFGDDAKTTA